MIFDNLNLVKLKQVRLSTNYYYLNFEQICKNIFYCNRLCDIYYYLNNESIGSLDLEIKKMYSNLIHLVPSQCQPYETKSKLYISEENFYNVNSNNFNGTMLTMEAEIRSVKEYLQDIPISKKIKLIKTVRNISDLRKFEEKLSLILNLKEHKENIQNYDEFIEFKKFFDILEKLKEKSFYKNEIAVCLKKKRKPIKNLAYSKSQRSLNYFEETIKIKKHDFLQSTEELIKEITEDMTSYITHNKTSIRKCSSNKGKVSDKIFERTRMFMRRIGF